jgi:hypothetical protein
MCAMRNLGIASALIVGFIAGGVTVGPCCWFAAQFQRAVADRRAAWTTHKSLVGTISSLGVRVVGLGFGALVVIVVLVAIRNSGPSTPADQHQPLPASSSSTSRR